MIKEVSIKTNPNASKRHHWKEDGKCMHCGLTRKVSRWKILTPERKLVYKHKMMYYNNLDLPPLANRPRCIGRLN